MIDQHILVTFPAFGISLLFTRYLSVFGSQQPPLTAEYLFLAKYLYTLVCPKRPFPENNTLFKVEKMRDIWQNMQDHPSFLYYFYAIHSKSIIIIFHYGSSTMESSQSSLGCMEVSLMLKQIS